MQIAIDVTEKDITTLKQKAHLFNFINVTDVSNTFKVYDPV